MMSDSELKDLVPITAIKDLRGAPLSILCVLGMAPDKSFDVGALAFFTAYGKGEVRQALGLLANKGFAEQVGDYAWKLTPRTQRAVGHA